MDKIRALSNILFCFAVFAALLASVSTANALSRFAYSSLNEKKNEQNHALLPKNGHGFFRFRHFDRVCADESGKETEQLAERVNMTVTKSATEDCATTGVFFDRPAFRTAWIGPEGATDSRDGTINNMLKATGPDYGDGVRQLPLTEDADAANLTLHGTDALWARVCSGACEEIE